ncbi:MAG TPA: hypothetical protein VH054_13240 [Polyangiaceae bacterium]|jgi:hypothetical protein|nr:hypothetical protein [Polyangiaceae bacterium]
MTTRLLLISALFVAACGGGSAENKETKQATNETKNADVPPDDPALGDGGATPEDTQPKKDPCVGFEMDLGAALMQAQCEVENPKPDAKSVDLKGKLDVSLVSPVPTLPPGARADLTLTLTNKSNAPLALFFTLDPTPRFPTETYDAKGKKRVDMPAGNPPALPKGMAAREATSHETAKITLVPNGKATMTIPWDAVRTTWAPEKLKGTPPEMGYPRKPNGSLPKGTYIVRVAMPLVLVFEGTEREISAPKLTMTLK